MSLAKQTYYPSNYTLTLMDTFGTKALPRPSSKKLQSSQSQSKMPAFACKRKVAFDKESLLQQIRLEKQKSYFINITNSQLHRNISKKKIKIERPVSSLLSRHPGGVRNSPLKRQIQQLLGEVGKQNEQIRSLKTSKKYNRFIELQTLKESYLQEVKQMKYKIKCFKYEIKQKKRVKREQRKRAKDIRLMNTAVQQRIDTENGFLAERLEDLCLKVKHAVVKQIGYRKERDRLLAEIQQLQTKTGTVYIKQERDADHFPQNDELRIQAKVEDLSNEESSDLEEQSSSSQFSSDTEQVEIRQQKVAGERRERNLSL